MSTASSLSGTLLLSIRPRYAELILAGSKTVELRKKGPKLAQGGLVVMYASSPTRALVGAFVLGGIIRAHPADLWREYGNKTGVSRAVFDRYYTEREEAFGLLVQNVRAFEKTVPLTAMRQSWRGFHPPQSYRYLHRADTGDGLRLSLPGLTTSLVTRFDLN